MHLHKNCNPGDYNYLQCPKKIIRRVIIIL